MANLELENTDMTKVGIPRKNPEWRPEPLIPQLPTPIRQPQPIPTQEPIKKPELVPITR